MDIRIAQFFKLQTSTGAYYYFQNYFVNEDKVYGGQTYPFAPFRTEGTTASLNGDNNVLQILFPNIPIALQLLSLADGNRLSRLDLATVWLLPDGTYTTNQLTEYYIGTGSSISDTTIELRFRSAIDSVASNFPNRQITRDLVGPLPLDSQIRLQ